MIEENPGIMNLIRGLNSENQENGRKINGIENDKERIKNNFDPGGKSGTLPKTETKLNEFTLTCRVDNTKSTS